MILIFYGKKHTITFVYVTDFVLLHQDVIHEFCSIYP